MSRRILLVKPPEHSQFNFGAFSLAVLAAGVRDLVDLEILDATNLDLGAAVKAVWQRQPDLIGITTMGITSVAPASAFVRALQQTQVATRKVPIVVGGHGASCLARPVLEAGADVVVRGEGEISFRRLLEERCWSEVPGTIHLGDGKLKTAAPAPPIEPLDCLSLPARDLLPWPTGHVHLMETSRGCPHACNFCETTRFFARRWRAHSPERVVQEVVRLVKKFNAWIIHISDDNFAADPRRVRRICQLLGGRDLPAFFMVSARADDLTADPELIPAMAGARFLRVSVGVETLDQRLAQAAGKPIPAAVYQAVFKRLRMHGIFSVASFIVGLPGETTEIRRGALRMALEVAPDAARFVPFLPMPGVPMAKGGGGVEHDPIHAREAQRLNTEFLSAPCVSQRLIQAVEAGGIRGILARGVTARDAALK
jgi:anaerobic magnesium-protoporphyrin IX monomethyl ester cyclase